jgi:hypothetical protein
MHPKIVKYNNSFYLTIKMTERYVIANVSLPLCIHPDGTISHLTEYMSVTLESRDKLPDNLPPSNAGSEFAKLMQQLFTDAKPTNQQPIDTTIKETPTNTLTVTHQETPTNTLTVTHQELNAHSGKKSIHNTSFKAKRPTYNRHTAKNRPSS